MYTLLKNENKARHSQYEENNTFNQKYEYKDEIEKELEELVKNILHAS